MNAAPIQISEADSLRFKKRIARARFDSDTPHEDVESALRANSIDLLVLRVPAGSHSLPRKLVDAGLKVVHADTLVYYAAELANWVIGSRIDDDRVFRLATQADRDAIETIARQGFSSYKSHYHATPELDERLVTEGYSEWAKSYVSDDRDDRLTYVVEQDGKAVGFVAATLDEEHKICDVVLNAVLPDFEGRGLYRGALDTLMMHAYSLGFGKGTISTQVWNYRVQRVWTRCGLYLTHAYDTYHVSCPPLRDMRTPERAVT